jgi:hypothetical protein
MLPALREEEVSNSVRKDGISFVFESRSLSAVIRFVYTPIEGNLTDLELEINNAAPVRPADSGGIAVEMGGQEWTSGTEEIERHLVSCEQVGDASVEARWQWKHGDELADFLYRFRLQGKSLVVEFEGGQGKAVGVDLGHVSEAVHPRLIRVPYLSLGQDDVYLLCTSGVFVSSLLDWYASRASRLFGPSAEEAQHRVRLNGGASYQPKSDGKRHSLHERWVLTVSRHFEEVLPALPTPGEVHQSELAGLVWYSIPSLASAEESYVEAYEKLRVLKQWGLDRLLVNHPADTWHDGEGHVALGLQGAADKGGDDALQEYLEAIADLGYMYSLYSQYRDIAPQQEGWRPELAALQPDGKPASASAGRVRLKPTEAAQLAPGHLQAMSEKFGNPAVYLGLHAASPPWDRIDCDGSLEDGATYLSVWRAEQRLLGALAAEHTVVGEGGSHWMYAGLLHGYLARQSGPSPCRQPLLVDFDLGRLHAVELDAGVGTVEQYVGAAIPPADKHSRSAHLDRYLAATLAFGHAGLLPEVQEWGLAAAVKTYYLLHRLQPHYLGVPVAAILYHHGGNLLETNEALISGAYEHSQLQITYAGGLQLWVNGSWQDPWTVTAQGASYVLPPASFVAVAPGGVLVYSADAGNGRMDWACCPDFLYCDTRGTRANLGPVTVDGAVLVINRKWEIDVLPLDCTGAIEVHPAHYWAERRLPRLRVLAFRPDDEEPEVLAAKQSEQSVVFEPREGAYRYRITLPEWMVEPGR